MIRLIGPGGAGKSTIGALLAERLNLPFLDLDRHLASRVGDVSGYINRHGYDAYARENVHVRACELYARNGCELRAVRHAAYPDLPEEIQLLWYKDLRIER